MSLQPALLTIERQKEIELTLETLTELLAKKNLFEEQRQETKDCL